MKKLTLLLLLSLSIFACKKEDDKKEEKPPQLTPPAWIIGKWANSDNTIKYEFKEHDFCKTLYNSSNPQCMAALYKDNDDINLADEATETYYKIFRLQNSDRVLVYEFVKISPDNMEEVRTSGNTTFTKVMN